MPYPPSLGPIDPSSYPNSLHPFSVHLSIALSLSLSLRSLLELTYCAGSCKGNSTRLKFVSYFSLPLILIFYFSRLVESHVSHLPRGCFGILSQPGMRMPKATTSRKLKQKDEEEDENGGNLTVPSSSFRPLFFLARLLHLTLFYILSPFPLSSLLPVESRDRCWADFSSSSSSLFARLFTWASAISSVHLLLSPFVKEERNTETSST